MRILHFIFLFFFIAGSHAWAMKIGVVDLNRALNESEAGIRSKNVLETKGRQNSRNSNSKKRNFGNSPMNYAVILF